MSAVTFNTTNASACVEPLKKFGNPNQSFTPSKRTTGRPLITLFVQIGWFATAPWLASLCLPDWSSQYNTALFVPCLVTPPSALSHILKLLKGRSVPTDGVVALASLE